MSEPESSVSTSIQRNCARDLAIGKIAEVASRIAGIGNRNVAQGGTALTNEMQHIA